MTNLVGGTGIYRCALPVRQPEAFCYARAEHTLTTRRNENGCVLLPDGRDDREIHFAENAVR